MQIFHKSHKTGYRDLNLDYRKKYFHHFSLDSMEFCMGIFSMLLTSITSPNSDCNMAAPQNLLYCNFPVTFLSVIYA